MSLDVQPGCLSSGNVSGHGAGRASAGRPPSRGEQGSAREVQVRDRVSLEEQTPKGALQHLLQERNPSGV